MNQIILLIRGSLCCFLYSIILIFMACKFDGKIENRENHQNQLNVDDTIKALFALEKNKLERRRGFFNSMDTIEVYNCSCIQNKVNNSLKIYVYLSSYTIELDNRSYYRFNIFSDSKYLNEPQHYSSLVRLENDTLYAKFQGNSRYFNSMYQMGMVSQLDTLDDKSQEIIFLIFNLDTKINWEIKDNFYLIDSIQVFNKIPVKDILIHHFRNFDYNTPSTHIPFIEDIFISKEKGILGFKYYSGGYDYSCWSTITKINIP